MLTVAAGMNAPVTLPSELGTAAPDVEEVYS